MIFAQTITSLRIRIALWTALLCGLALIVFMAAMAVKVFNNMSEEAEYELRQMALRIDGLIAADADGKDIPREVMTSLSAEDAELQVIRVRTEGGELVVERDDWPNPSEKRQHRFADKLAGSFSHQWRDDRLWLFFDGVSGNGHEIDLAIELSEIQTEILGIMKDFLYALPFALAVVGWAAWWVSRTATRPVIELTDVAEHIGYGELDRRIPETKRDDELGNLIRVFNRMMDRLELSHQQAVRFSSDASHELRTPLTALQGKIEAAIQKADDGTVPVDVVGELSDQVQRLKSIAESLLFLARADAGKLPLTRSPIDVPVLLGELQEDLHDMEPDPGITIDLQTATDVAVSGDERLVRLALFNLLRNALKFNEVPAAGGEPFVRLRVSAATEGMVTFRVSNTGPVIAQQDFERVFDRFSRLHESGHKRGTGLGLSLSRTVADLHNGRLWLEASAAGVNTFAFSLPVDG